MNDIEHLLQRLNEIGATLANRTTALALIGLGSVGLELERLDRFSDLDFFVIVQPGTKADYLSDLSWLASGASIAYRFQNTKDGYKVLYEDGIFCEFAVFEPGELEHIPFAAGRIIWRAPGVDETIAVPRLAGSQTPQQQPAAWLLGEALTNLYVGLLREHRGERLSAMRFIQSYAVDRVLSLYERLQPASNDFKDPFSPERRFEFRYPQAVARLPKFLQGYEKNRESALAILVFLDEHFEIEETMKSAITRLCQPQEIV